MNVHDLTSTRKKQKAGIVPYYWGDRGLEFLFMVSSDQNFGGADPQIAKGHVDKNEDTYSGALREGSEELGLKIQNCLDRPKLIVSTILQGLDETYHFDCYVVPVKNKEDFSQTDKETEKTIWMTPDEFKSSGRKSQIFIVEKAMSFVLLSTTTINEEFENEDGFRPLRLIAKEIRADWTNISKSYAFPYWVAMADLNSIDDKYGADTAYSIVLYFLSNAASWKGEKARAIKLELKKMCKFYEQNGL